MNEKTLVRQLHAARKDKTPRFRESIELVPQSRVMCESKQELFWWSQFKKALATGEINPSEIRFDRLFEALCPGEYHEMRSEFGTSPVSASRIMEAAGGVASSDFSNITGQILYTAMMEALPEEELPFQALIPTQPTQFDGEKLPDVAGLGDQAEVVPELGEYPLVGTGEDWIESPQTTKRGYMVPISKEALFFDRTGLILERARRVGESLKINKEKRAIDCVIDENTTAHRHNWRGTEYATFQTTAPWGNVTTSNGLVDWTDLDNADQTLNAIVDPNTGEPVVVEADKLICVKALEKTALRIRNATEVTTVTPGYATSGNPTETRGGNPVGGAFDVVTSRLLASRLATDTDWFYGNPAQACVYMENWPITVTQEDEVANRDIVVQFKCSERGQYFVRQPRKLSKCTA